MKTNNGGRKNQSSGAVSPVSRERQLDFEPVPGSQGKVSKGWSHDIDFSGARLFRFKRPNGDGFYWKAEMGSSGFRVGLRSENALVERDGRHSGSQRKRPLRRAIGAQRAVGSD